MKTRYNRLKKKTRKSVSEQKIIIFSLFYVTHIIIQHINRFQTRVGHLHINMTIILYFFFVFKVLVGTALNQRFQNIYLKLIYLTITGLFVFSFLFLECSFFQWVNNKYKACFCYFIPYLKYNMLVSRSSDNIIIFIEATNILTEKIFKRNNTHKKRRNNTTRKHKIR